MEEKKILHEDYQQDHCFGKDGFYYKNYFFPLSLENGPDQVVKVISGNESYLGRCPGFCCLKGFFLTEKQMKGHECRRKQCSRFIRAPFSESYWQKEEEKKMMKKMKKAGIVNK